MVDCEQDLKSEINFLLHSNPEIVVAIMGTIKICIIINDHLQDACIKIDDQPLMYLCEGDIINLLMIMTNIDTIALKISYDEFMAMLHRIANQPRLEQVHINYASPVALDEDTWSIDENNNTLQKIEFTPFSNKWANAFSRIHRTNTKSAARTKN